jgi:hypothetical protein
VSGEGSLSVQGMSSRSWRNFAVGVLTSTTVLLLACGVLVPRFAELEALGAAVVEIALATAFTGLALCIVRRSRAVGAGVVAGAVLGLALAWSALIAYVGLFMR